MSDPRNRRVAKELADIHADKDNSGITVTVDNPNSMERLTGTFTGPPDTPYAGGEYKIKIKITSEYPFKAPEMKFLTSVWHPNISSQTGAICLNTLGNAWSPVQTIKTTLLSLRLLLECPNPSDPQDHEAAGMLRNSPAAFANEAHEWAIHHAKAPRCERWAQEYLAERAGPPRVQRPVEYGDYDPALVNRFDLMGFEVPDILEAFQFVGVPRRSDDPNDAPVVLNDSLSNDVIQRIMARRQQ